MIAITTNDLVNYFGHKPLHTTEFKRLFITFDFYAPEDAGALNDEYFVRVIGHQFYRSFILYSTKDGVHTYFYFPVGRNYYFCSTKDTVSFNFDIPIKISLRKVD